MKMLSYNQAKIFYDSFGAKQDKQFYEEPAIKSLISHGDFTSAENVFEFGCGTGRLAAYLLKNVLPASCQYHGIDISETMIELCRSNLAAFSERARCSRSEGEPVADLPAESVDHFIATYVLDLLSDADISIVLNSAHNVLLPGGYLCIAGLTNGATFISRVVEAVWSALFKLNPKIVGGCRPLKVSEKLQRHLWAIEYSATVISYGVASEVLIAKKISE